MTKNAAWPEGSFLDSLATGVLATDPKGKIVYANAASEILSGASKNRLLGISAEAVFPSARRWTERFLSDTVRGSQPSPSGLKCSARAIRQKAGRSV